LGLFLVHPKSGEKRHRARKTEGDGPTTSPEVGENNWKVGGEARKGRNGQLRPKAKTNTNSIPDQRNWNNKTRGWKEEKDNWEGAGKGGRRVDWSLAQDPRR